MSGGMWRALGLNCLMLAWVGLLAIGASGVIAAAMSATLGKGFVAGDMPGDTGRLFPELRGWSAH